MLIDLNAVTGITGQQLGFIIEVHKGNFEFYILGNEEIIYFFFLLISISNELNLIATAGARVVSL